MFSSNQDYFNSDDRPETSGAHSRGATNGFSEKMPLERTRNDTINSRQSQHIRPMTNNTTNYVRASSENKKGYERHRAMTKNIFSKQASFANKILPRQIPLDKEKLYEELMHVKMMFNSLSTENTKLKTQKQNLQEENQKLFKSTQSTPGIFTQMEMLSFGEPKPIKSPKENLLIELRTKIRDLQKEVEKKDEALNLLKKSIKQTKQNELEIELENYKLEVGRLRQLVHQLMLIEVDSQNPNSGQIISTLRQDNVDLTLIIKNLQSQNDQLNFQVRQLDQQRKKVLKDKEGLQRLNVELQSQLASLKARDPFNGVKPVQTTKIEKVLQHDLDLQIQEVNKLNHQLIHKEKQIYDLEKKVKDLQAEIHEMYIQYEKEKQQLRSAEKVEVRDSYITSGLTKKRTQQFNKSATFDSQCDKMGAEDSVKIPQQVLNRPVLKEDVIEIGQKLKFRLLNSRIPITELETLIGHQIQTLHDVSECLHGSPFCLEKQEAILLARYLTEDTESLDTKAIIFDPDTQANPSIIRSILRNLMDNFWLESKEAQAEMIEEISQIFTKCRGQFFDAIVMLKQSRDSKQEDGYCHLKDFMDALQMIDTKLNNKLMTCVLQKNFQIVGNVNRVNYKELFEAFKKDLSIKSSQNVNIDEGQNSLPNQPPSRVPSARARMRLKKNSLHDEEKAFLGQNQAQEQQISKENSNEATQLLRGQSQEILGEPIV